MKKKSLLLLLIMLFTITAYSQVCIAPSDLTISNISGSSAEFGWTENGTATLWEIEIVLSGVAPTGVGIQTTANPYTSTDLAPETSYQLYIQSICETDNQSSWVGPISFETPCSALPIPYIETVETQEMECALTIAECWSATDSNFQWLANSGDTLWGTTGPNGAANGSRYFYTETTGGNVGTTCDPFRQSNTGDVAELTSPIFDLTTGNSTGLSLSFNYHMYGESMGELHVDVFDGSTWVNSVFSLIGEQQISDDDPWEQANIDISEYNDVVNFQVRFRGIKGGISPTGYNSDMAIDDIAIESFCDDTIFDSLTLQASETITDDVVSFCNEGALELAVSGGDFDGSETYEWQLNGSTISNETTNTLSGIETAGIYSVIVSLGDCFSTLTVTVNQYYADSSFTFNSPGCNDVSATILGNTGGVFSFADAPSDGASVNNSTGAISNGSAGETYIVSYTTPVGPCQESSTESITLLELDDASFYIDEESITCYSADIIVTGTDIGTFSFDSLPTDGAIINENTGEISGTEPNTTYTVIYTTNDMCSNIESITYTSSDNCIIPQGISPNNDTLNDYFDISWLQATNITIYNRYGTKVYEKSNYRNEWNGLSNKSKELSTGTYFYVIELGNEKPMNGWVYLNRGN